MSAMSDLHAALSSGATWETANGSLRVRLEVDTDAHMPDADERGHVYDWQAERYGVWLATALTAEEAPDAPFTRLDPADAGDRATVERWLRIYHDAVSVAWAKRADFGYLMAVVTRGQAETWGASPDAWAGLAAGELEEWTAWDRGDVYGYVIEERVTWDRVTPVRLGSDSTRTTWEHVDSCWGFYGFDYAAESAMEALAGFAETEGER